MPKVIGADQRSRIVYYAALGYSQQEIAEEVGVSRNTVRKYLRLTREAVEAADEPERILADIVRNRHDWDRSTGLHDAFGDLPM